MSPDVAQGSALLGAAQWVEVLLAGPLVTGIAIFAVAGVGFALLSGRMAVRRATGAAAGCFLLFGASEIARGLFATASDAGGAQPVVLELPPPPPPPPAPAPQNVVTDPYAGATIAG